MNTHRRVPHRWIGRLAVETEFGVTSCVELTTSPMRTALSNCAFFSSMRS